MTIEEIDETLDRVASSCSFSSSDVLGHVSVDATAELVKGSACSNPVES